jgi:hypothetical protein
MGRSGENGLFLQAVTLGRLEELVFPFVALDFVAQTSSVGSLDRPFIKPRWAGLGSVRSRVSSSEPDSTSRA